jgi:hypothetical protein
MTCRDISTLEENLRLQQEVKQINLMQQFLSHEMLSPLKCVNMLIQDMIQNERVADKTLSVWSMIKDTNNLML